MFYDIVINLILSCLITEMAEGNGELVDEVGVKSDDRADGERTEDYPKLIEYGLDKRVRLNIQFWLQFNSIVL